MTDQTRFLLNESDLPKYWYNINADSPVPPTPVLHPGTLEPVTPDFLAVLFPMDLILQEISTERSIEIMELLNELNRGGITILLVTHEAEMAAFARTIVHFRDGLIESVERGHRAGAEVSA